MAGAIGGIAGGYLFGKAMDYAVEGFTKSVKLALPHNPASLDGRNAPMEKADQPGGAEELRNQYSELGGPSSPMEKADQPGGVEELRNQYPELR